ncbi:DUF4249 domain-containing protein [Lewinella sp. IMCC34183]|uniref:DUF4249 domain-containing protein n=1 Tax=Lewinella sp. IMCC34183 TaxID=2248762 RepID=UPI000E26F4D5|nr:DUF4249 domain-containing protein [Lewinella sp. IMCC34183]
MWKALFAGLIRPLSLVCLGVFVLWSCEEAIELDIEIPKSRLVINSSFVPHQPVSLTVTATRPRGGAAVTEISDAQVSLLEGNELAEELTYHPNKESGQGGYYRTLAFRPEVGHDYTIHVSVPGYDPVTAVSSIPESVPIRALSVSELSRRTEAGEQICDYTLSVDYADPENETNYYDLRISQLVIPFEVSAAGDTIRRTPYIKSIRSPQNPVAEQPTISLLLQDRGPAPPVNLRLQSRLNPDRELLGRVVAELRTVSPEYFFYQRSLALPIEYPSMGLEEPVIFFNNVESGLGVFAGYNSVEKDLSLADQ